MKLIKTKKIILQVILYLFILPCRSNNKLIYLISTPRSLSVAFLRMIQAHGQFTIFHEPSQCAFNSITWPELVPMIYLENAPKTFKAVKQKIFNELRYKNVFAKEMVFAVKDFLITDEEFLIHPDIYFVFLLRAPNETVISYCKNSIKIPNDLSHRIGCKAMYELIKVIKQKAKNPPFYIFTEKLYQNPHKIISEFCKHVGIEFKENALKWEDLGSDFAGELWNEYKKKEFVQKWHYDAIRSNGFNKPEIYETNKNGPTFSEIINPDHRKIIIQAYQENLPYYKLLINEFSN